MTKYWSLTSLGTCNDKCIDLISDWPVINHHYSKYCNLIGPLQGTIFVVPVGYGVIMQQRHTYSAIQLIIHNCIYTYYIDYRPICTYKMDSMHIETTFLNYLIKACTLNHFEFICTRNTDTLQLHSKNRIHSIPSYIGTWLCLTGSSWEYGKQRARWASWWAYR